MRPGPIALRPLALATLLAFGCAAARPPAQASRPFPRRVALAEPELELWMEGTRPIDPAESARALEESRAALAEALAGRDLDEPAPEALLVVRSRALARTGERRAAQTLSWVAIAVVVVALVVLAVVESKSSGRARPGHLAGPVRPPPWNPRPGSPALPRPYPPPPFGFDVGLGVYVPPVAPDYPPEAAKDAEFLEGRGWFDGDATALTFELVGPDTGEVLCRSSVAGGEDPRDARAVSRLVEEGLRGLEERCAREGGTGGGHELPPPPLFDD